MDDINSQLLAEIKKRRKSSESWAGIATADRYVQTIQDCVGSDLCYRFAAKGRVSFNDVLQKSASTLVYNNEDMVIRDKYGKNYELRDDDGDELELPKNTLMVFKHVLTSPRKDRDGDVMRTQGARPDPKMLLLWQHVHTLPIGKMLRIHSHTSKSLEVVSAIIDMNDLCHDSAVMVDNGMGRFSHGFRALDFVKVKGEPGDTTGGGFDIKAFEIMEESLVSVPANTDAETQEVILSLVEGGKLTSSLMKGVGKNIREKRPSSVKVSLDVSALSQTPNDEAEHDEHDREKGAAAGTSCSGKQGCGCGCSGPSTKDDEPSDGEKDSTGKQEMNCPKCGSPLKGGVCEKCGAGLKEEEKSLDLSGMLEGSWEHTENCLKAQCRKHLSDNDIPVGLPGGSSWCDVIGTYPGHAIVATEIQGKQACYQVSWKSEDGSPALFGKPKEVEVQLQSVLIEKSKRFKTKSVVEPVTLLQAKTTILAELDSPGRREMIKKLLALETSEVRSAQMKQFRNQLKKT